MSISKSIILNVDSYKTSQYVQYPPNTTAVYSYIESRGGEYKETVFFGLQAFIKEYLEPHITQADIDTAEKILGAHGVPFNKAGWQYILDRHSGALPLRIKAVKEGTVLPTKNVLVTVENTDPECFWLTSYIETALLRGVWYPTTVATHSWNMKQIIKSALERTGDPNQVDFKLHDFGDRGVSSFESAGLGGAAHLVNFKGTDTITALLAASEYYGAEMAGFSIPAMEHSTVTSWGKDSEAAAYENMLKQYAKPGSILACVSDSYDIYNAVEHIWGEELRQQVIDSGATVVIRPDSGNPADMVLFCVAKLADKFGYSVNDKGFKVLNNVRVIQGDGISGCDDILNILLTLETHGYSADNIAFGMGGGLLQKLDRDTMKFAMKASAAKVDNEWRDVFKDPVSDSGKKSKRGLVTLWQNGGEYRTSVAQPTEWADTATGEWQEALELVYDNGLLMRNQTFDEIRQLANSSQA